MGNRGHSKQSQCPMTPMREKDVDVGNVEVQIKRDPTDDNNYQSSSRWQESVPMVQKKSEFFLSTFTCIRR